MRKDELKVTPSSGNIFADIGLPHPERVLARSQLMIQITDIIRERGLTQQQAAAKLGISQPKVSCLMNGKLSMFSLEHLLELLNALDRNVEIIIMPKMRKEKSGTTKVRTLERMNHLLSHSMISEADAIEYGKIIKKRVWKKHQAARRSRG